MAESKKPARILVVDDEPTITEFVSYALNKEGYAADVAATAEEALVLAQRTPYDLFVLDVMLPGADGYALCRAIRAHSDAPVLFLSARDSELDKVAGLEMGADEYLAALSTSRPASSSCWRITLRDLLTALTVPTDVRLAFPGASFSQTSTSEKPRQGARNGKIAASSNLKTGRIL